MTGMTNNKWEGQSWAMTVRNDWLYLDYISQIWLNFDMHHMTDVRTNTYTHVEYSI